MKRCNNINIDECLLKINSDFGLLSKYPKSLIREVLEYTNIDGVFAAARKYNISRFTIQGWRNPDRNRTALKKQYTKNRQHHIVKAREQRKKDPQRNIIINGRSDRKRYHKDPGFRLKMLMRTRIWRTIKDQSGIKVKRTMELLGCTMDEFKTYFESKFQQGMNWENYGEWHIDHIIPCSTFNLTIAEDQIKCFHYTNLRPLWKRDNLDKGDNLPSLAIINCAGQKKTYKCQAQQMYDDSATFRAARDYVANNYDKYFILSAYLALLEPTEEIEPYDDVTMHIVDQNKPQYKLSLEEKQEWAEAVFNSVNWGMYIKVHFYIGANYWKPLEPLFKKYPHVKRFELPSGTGNVINSFKDTTDENQK